MDAKQKIIEGLEAQIDRLEAAGDTYAANQKRRFLAAYRNTHIRAFIVPDRAYMHKVGAL